MRVLYLCPDLGIPVLGRKGASVHVRGLAEAFQRAGDEIVLATPMLSKSPWEPPASLALPVEHLPLAPEAVEVVLAVKAFMETVGAADSPLPGELRRILWSQQAAVKMKRRFEREPPDFIYERDSLYGIVGALLASELGVPLLVEVNAPIAAEQARYRATALGELGGDVERWALPRADAVLAVSEPLRDYVIGVGVDPQKAHVIANGVDTARFHPAPPDPEVRARWGLGDGPVAGFTGGLRPWHGVRALPALVERLARRHPDLRLVVAGDGPLRGELADELQARGLERNAVLTGSIPHEEVPGLIRHFDVALAPYDALDHAFYFSPLKLFEYMACAKPVVAARVGQIATIVEDGVTGLTYEPGDGEALADACERLLADPALGDRQGKAAAARVQEAYTWDHNARRVRELARSLMR